MRGCDVPDSRSNPVIDLVRELGDAQDRRIEEVAAKALANEIRIGVLERLVERIQGGLALIRIVTPIAFVILTPIVGAVVWWVVRGGLVNVQAAP